MRTAWLNGNETIIIVKSSLTMIGCTSTCQIEPGWTCTGQPSVCSEHCGNFIVTKSEQCDDGNLGGGDGCNALCQIELGWNCSRLGLGSTCSTICGDRV